MTPIMDDATSTLTPRTRSISLHPKVLLAAVLAAVAMVPVAVFLAAVGVLILQVAGGAATDTSTVVMVVAIAVTDFWGGGIVSALTRARRADVAVSWALARIPILIIAALISTRFAVLAPLLLVIAGGAAWIGARMAMVQARIRASAAR